MANARVKWFRQPNNEKKAAMMSTHTHNISLACWLGAHIAHAFECRVVVCHYRCSLILLSVVMCVLAVNLFGRSTSSIFLICKQRNDDDDDSSYAKNRRNSFTSWIDQKSNSVWWTGQRTARRNIPFPYIPCVQISRNIMRHLDVFHLFFAGNKMQNATQAHRDEQKNISLETCNFPCCFLLQ